MANSSIESIRKRLDGLTVTGSGSPQSSPAASLASCRARQEELRALKREVLRRIFAQRSAIHEQSLQARGPRLSVSEAWKRREEGARNLLADVRRRVTGMVDGDKVEAVGEWSEVNLEIDAHLESMEGLESDLVDAVGSTTEVGSTVPPPLPVEDRAEMGTEGNSPGSISQSSASQASASQVSASPSGGRSKEAKDASDDDFYAAVGAEVRKGAKGGTFCPHCGLHIDAQDRFCRRCGRSLS